MYTHLIHKDRPQFWKAWNARFKNNLSKGVIINGHVKDEEIANDFASHFRSVFYNSDDDVNSNMSYYNYRDSVANKGSTSECNDDISVEVVDRCIRDLKLGKACGPDDLCAQHLRYSHPLIVVMLKSLFKSILLHGFVPDKFGTGISIPLNKDKSDDANDLNNYRAITLFPIISKVFEMVCFIYVTVP